MARKLVRIDKYTDDNKNPIAPRMAKYRYITMFNDEGVKGREIEYSPEGFDIKGGSTSRIFYEGDELPQINYMATEEFREEEHPREPKGSPDAGKFTSGGGGSVSDYKERKTKEIKPKKEERENLKRIDKEITDNVKNVVKELGLEDKISFVEMQGSYAKNTDLTGSSDLDLFVGFKKDVPREDFERLGLEIGQRALSKYSPYKRYAEHPFTEAFVGDVEIQIVPAYDISLEDIRNKNLGSATDRTPHQTRFMNENLTKEQKGDVRLLKKFMQENRAYGSDEKIKGFSGYSAEAFIHELGSFDNVINFFANFEKGKEIGLPAEKHDTPFTLVDPIDPNRNLVSAFSDQKVARMVKVSREFLKTGEIPKPTSTNMDSIGISIGYDERSDDKLFGEINRSITAISKHLGEQGYKTNTEDERITEDWNVSIPRVSYDLDKENKKINIHLGLNNFENTNPVRIRGPPIENTKAVDSFMEANPDSKIQMEVVDGEKRLVRYEERKNKTAQNALNDLLNTRLEKIGISKGIIDDVKNNGFSVKDKKERKFENLV